MCFIFLLLLSLVVRFWESIFQLHIFFSLGPFVLSLSVSVIHPMHFCIIPEKGECQHFERGHLKGKMKQAILCHGFTEPYYDFCGCISSHMNCLELRSQKVCVCVREVDLHHAL